MLSYKTHAQILYLISNFSVFKNGMRTPFAKINSKWIKHPNVRPYTIIELLEKNIGRILFDINHNNTFLAPSPRVV